jgi:hypothetical protein
MTLKETRRSRCPRGTHALGSFSSVLLFSLANFKHRNGWSIPLPRRRLSDPDRATGDPRGRWSSVRTDETLCISATLCGYE